MTNDTNKNGTEPLDLEPYKNSAGWSYWMQQRIIQEIERLREGVNSLFDAIKHGDNPHQTWLKNAIEEHFKRPIKILTTIPRCGSCEYWENSGHGFGVCHEYSDFENGMSRFIEKEGFCHNHPDFNIKRQAVEVLDVISKSLQSGKEEG